MVFKYSDWYEKNRKRVNELRRKRYDSDPEYRNKAIVSSKVSREKSKDKRIKERQERRAASKVGVIPSGWKVITVQGDDGKEIKAVTIGALAKICGVSVKALRLWESQGVFPTTPLRSKRGDRLYTEAMISDIYDLLDSQGKVGKQRKKRSNKKTLKVRLSTGEDIVVDLFPISTVAGIVGRNVSTLEQMEQRGLLPETPLRSTSVRHRMYSAEMIEVVKNAFEQLEGTDWGDLHSMVTAGWSSLGFVGSEIVEEKDVSAKKKSKANEVAEN